MGTLSSYARRFLGGHDKPDVDIIEGLSPTIAIDQRSIAANPRSTVGTLTEIYDHLRVLYAAIGRPHCPQCGVELVRYTPVQLAEKVLQFFRESNGYCLAPVLRGQKGSHSDVLEELQKNAYRLVRADGKVYSLEEASALSLDRGKRHDIDVIFNELVTKDTPLKSVLGLVETALDMGDGFISAVSEDFSKEEFFSRYYTCVQCGLFLPLIEPLSFSFNNPLGACERCMGLGTTIMVVPELVVPNKKLSIGEGAIRPWLRLFSNQKNLESSARELADKYHFSVNEPVEKLTQHQLNKLLWGDDQCVGVIPDLEKRYRQTESDYMRKEIEKYMQVQVCPLCSGKRLKKSYLAVTIGGLSISDLVNLGIGELEKIMLALTQKKDHPLIKEPLHARDAKIGEHLFKEILGRLSNINRVGLYYLTLDRSVTTLSGGELQRLKLAAQISAMLVDVIYILDEPSVGLHPCDTERLIKTFQTIKEMGNTVCVVEHDESIIRSADWVIDMGPGAGKYGGKIVAVGAPQDIEKKKESLTGRYLANKTAIEMPRSRRAGSGKFIAIKGAAANNLKNLDVSIPLGKLICVTGVSGSGKSTLIIDILAKALSVYFYHSKELPAPHKAIEGLHDLDKIVSIDQSPIGRTPRSNPATYTGVFTLIRDLFVEVREAKIKGFKAGHFSFNVRGGRCEVCQGDGVVKIGMQFLQDVYIPCEECQGTRYAREALEVLYNGKNIADILNMTVEEARKFFMGQPAIYEKLRILYEVGLGYIHLGQSATTLSGGEAQRIKLAAELSHRATGNTLYILDEPTTGLHFEDVKRLLHILNQLVDRGNTVLVIEHHLDVIKCSDWVIDLGPDGGDRGGELVAEGTPEDVAKVAASYTGRYLKKYFK